MLEAPDSAVLYCIVQWNIIHGLLESFVENLAVIMASSDLRASIERRGLLFVRMA